MWLYIGRGTLQPGRQLGYLHALAIIEAKSQPDVAQAAYFRCLAKLPLMTSTCGSPPQVLRALRSMARCSVQADSKVPETLDQLWHLQRVSSSSSNKGTAKTRRLDRLRKSFQQRRRAPPHSSSMATVVQRHTAVGHTRGMTHAFRGAGCLLVLRHAPQRAFLPTLSSRLAQIQTVLSPIEIVVCQRTELTLRSNQISGLSSHQCNSMPLALRFLLSRDLGWCAFTRKVQWYLSCPIARTRTETPWQSDCCLLFLLDLSPCVTMLRSKYDVALARLQADCCPLDFVCTVSMVTAARLKASSDRQTPWS
ncbi:hypothetical protein LIA77_01120 [Sarocladium implicatum]|nr:hypothetical protein LIA77_01120 [Sarocladium implicatum]